MDETVNQRIKELRKELKLTQSEFASAITISSGQLACIETGRRNVNNRTIKLICDSFGINDDWLRRGAGSRFVNGKNNKYTKLLTLYSSVKPKYQKFILDSLASLIKIQEQE